METPGDGGGGVRHRRLLGLAGPRVLNAASDERLIALARDGDDGAFAVLMARYRAPLHRYCLKFLPTTGADDAVQQTFVNAYAALQREGTATPRVVRPWLYRIAHNAALNIARDPQAGLGPIPETVAARAGTDDLFQQRDQLDRVVGAMKALPETQREVMVRHALAGESHDRIAADLGLSAAAVRQHAYRARAAVRAAAAALIPGPILRALPWLGGEGALGEPAAALSGAVVAKTAVAVVLAGAVGGGAVHTIGAREHHARTRHPARVALAAPAEASPHHARTVAVHGPARPPVDPDDRVVRSPAPASRPAGDDRPSATRRSSGDGTSGTRGSSGSGSGSSGSGSDSSGSGSGSSGSGSDSSGSGSGSSGSTEGGSSATGSSGSGSGSSGSSGSSGTSGTSRSSGSSGSGASGSGSGSSGSGSSGSSGSGSSGSSEPVSSGSSGSGSSGTDTSGSSGSGSGAPDPTLTVAPEAAATPVPADDDHSGPG